MESGKKPNQTNLLLRILAAAYLLYSAYLLIKASLAGKLDQNLQILGVFAAGLFVAFAVWLIVNTYKKYKLLLSESEESGAEPSESDTVPTESPAEDVPLSSDNCVIPEKLWDCVLKDFSSCLLGNRGISKHFTAKEYAPSFERFTKDCHPILVRADTALRGCAKAERDNLLSLLSHRFVQDVEKSYASIPSKRQLALQQDEDKRDIALYLVPMIRELHLSISEKLAQELVDAWNEAHPKTPIGLGSYQRILDAFQHRLSFLRGGWQKRR